jgi:hypothetical protein
MQAKVVGFLGLGKSNRGKYAALARLAMRTFRVPAMPVLLSYGAWWLAGPGSLDERLWNGDFESAELKFVERLRPGMVAFDIGAHHGLYSVLAAKCAGEQGQVRSFVSSLRERKYLKQNLGINHCHNVTVEEPDALRHGFDFDSGVVCMVWSYEVIRQNEALGIPADTFRGGRPAVGNEWRSKNVEAAAVFASDVPAGVAARC